MLEMWLILLLCLCFFVVLYIILYIKVLSKDGNRKRLDGIYKTLIVLGSGGHTTEMLRTMSGLSKVKYRPRIYVVAETDRISLNKVKQFEEETLEISKEPNSPSYEVYKIPRSREVRQSYITSVYSTLRSILYCIPIIWKLRPDLVLCNGPGTCIPVCLLAFLLKFRHRCVIIFVESICRVQTLSASGLILYYGRLADEIFVQWPQLRIKYPLARFVGRFV